MAYRRSITSRVKLFYQQQHRVTPSFPHIHRHGRGGEEQQAKSNSRNLESRNNIPHNRFLGTSNNFSHSQRSMNFLGYGLVSCRSFSTSSVGEEAADGIEFYSEAMKAAAEAAPVVSEVAVAAADSFFPVAAIQYLIDYVHCYTGFNWWASIAVTTVLIRCIQIPFYIHELKIISKCDAIRVKAVVDAIDKLSLKDDDDESVLELKARATKLWNEVYKPLSKSYLVTGAIHCIFFFALTNMAEKIPSFKEGGMFWFTDLTTPDRMFLFPILMAMTLLKFVPEPIYAMGVLPPRRVNSGNNIFTALSIPVLMYFPKVVFCHWFTSRLFSLAFAFVIEKPEVQKFLGLSFAPLSTDQKPKA